VHGLSEQPLEQVKSRHGSDDDRSRAAASNTNSVPESGHGRNGSNFAEKEQCKPAESEGSSDPTRSSGRISSTRRTDR